MTLLRFAVSVVVGSTLTLCGAADVELPSVPTKFPAFPHEPSGAVALGPGHVLIVEDEKEHPLDLMAVGRRVEISDEGLVPPTPLNDLEGVTRDGEGRVYAITSHSSNKGGEVKASRERLARFRITEGGISDFEVVGNLKRAFDRIPELQASLRVTDRQEPGSVGKFEIEGLAWSAEEQALLIGCRGPLLDGKAIVLFLTNPDGLFRGDPPNLRSVRLDLAGQGIRGIEFDPVLGGFVVIGGSTSGPRRFDLWLWDGKGATAKRLTVPTFEALRQPEGISSVEVGEAKKLFVASDDGTTDKDYYKHPARTEASNTSTPGSYLFLDYAPLEAQAD
jgi:hypothetical protein